MTLDFKPLENENRLMMEVELEPIQGRRFQPAGFANLGHSFYDVPGSTSINVIIDTEASMANRLEQVCWDDNKENWVPALQNLPMVKVVDSGDGFLSNSLLESHRIASPYILKEILGKKDHPLYKALEKSVKADKVGSFDYKAFVKVLLDFDPNSLLHGVWISDDKLGGGRGKLARALSAFIEGEGAQEVALGGAKHDRLSPSGKSEGGADERFGHIPISKYEWVAEKIVAYFKIDLQQIRGYNLGKEVEKLLIGLAFFKIQKFLSEGLRLRTACDLDVKDNGITVKKPKGFDIPALDQLTEQLPDMIKCVFGDKGEDHILKVRYTAKKHNKK